MADSDAWATLRAYATAPIPTPDEPDMPDAPDEGEDGTPNPTPDAPDDDKDEPSPQPRRHFSPSALGATLDRALPSGLVQRAARIPVPGGLAPLVLALAFFLLAIVPVGADGSTRLGLLWRVLTGGAQLPPSPRQSELDALGAAINAETSTVAGAVLGTSAQDANMLWQTWWGLAGSIVQGRG